MSATHPSSPGIFATIGTVFRQNRVPCLVLNLFAVALVASYYQVPALAGFWESVGDFKNHWSFVFSCVSTMFAAAVMPFFIQMGMGTLPAEGRWQRLTLLMLFWGYRGMEIDLFYRFQGWFFGHGHDGATLAKKVFVDQFVMSPIWFVPTYVIALRWVEMGGSWARTRPTLNREFWTRTCPMVLITNWLIWIPAVALIYSLPTALQFPLFTFVMCFFILVVTVMTMRGNEGPDASGSRVE